MAEKESYCEVSERAFRTVLYHSHYFMDENPEHDEKSLGILLSDLKVYAKEYGIDFNEALNRREVNYE